MTIRKCSQCNKNFETYVTSARVCKICNDYLDQIGVGKYYRFRLIYTPHKPDYGIRGNKIFKLEID